MMTTEAAHGLGSRAPREPAEGFSRHSHSAVAEKALTKAGGDSWGGFGRQGPSFTVSVGLFLIGGRFRRFLSKKNR